MMDPAIQTYASRDGLAEAVAALLAERLRALIAGAGRARVAVPGGTTPGPMLTILGQADLDWGRVAVTLTDERLVPAESARSNQRLLGETLFKGRAAAATFVPLLAAAADRAGTLDGVCEGLRRVALPLDIAVLGMGADMHTASLFPGADGLAEALAPDAPPAVAIAAPGADEPRVTLSAPALAAAERHILIVGAGKRAALERARAIADPRRAPVCAVLAGATVHYAD